MENKLKAISNNVTANDTVVDLIPRSERKSEQVKAKTQDSKDHVCQKNVPVMFATLRGIHLRKYNRSSSNNYSTLFCDVERWNLRNHIESIGLTPPSTSSERSAVKSIKIVQQARDGNG